MTQQQRQSHISSNGTAPDRKRPEEGEQGPSLSRPASPDAGSPYQGPPASPPSAGQPTLTRDHGPEELAHPYFSEAQSTLGAFAPVERPGDPYPEPEDPQPPAGRSEQSGMAEHPELGATFATSAGAVRAGMPVLDAYGHTIGMVAAIEGERMRLTSTDPHDDGVAFLPVSLIAGIDGDQVLLGGRGDASFGMSSE